MKWSFYNPATGEFTGRTFTGAPSMLDANTPAGMVAIEGKFDPMCQRFDTFTGQVVDYQPPSPGPDYEWLGRRWILNAAAQARAANRQDAIAQIQELERRQARAVREAVLNGNHARLEAIEVEIAALRSRVTA